MSSAPLAPERPEIKSWLEQFVRAHGGVAGTVHQRSGQDELTLAATMNIPEIVARVVQMVPRGKGMAGLAFQNDAPIASCNIKTDDSGQVRPGAKAVNAQAGVALPVHDDRGQIRAIVGIAFMEERQLTDEELASYAKAAATLPPL